MLAFLILAAIAVPSYAEIEDIDDILFELDDAEGQHRIDLIKELCQIRDDEAAPALVSVLVEPKQEDTPKIQELVFQAMLHLKNKDIVPELKMALLSEDPQAKVYAVRLLARLLGPKAFGLIEGQLKAESLIRTAAIKAVGDCQHPKGRAALEKLLRDPISTSDDHIFIRMSLVKLGSARELPKLLESHQRLISEALMLEKAAKYIDTFALLARNRNRTKFLWQLEKELRTYFTELPDAMIPILVDNVERSEQDEGIQLVFELVPRIMSPERCETFEPMLSSRFLGLRQLALHYFLKYDKPKLRETALTSLRNHIASGRWLDRRLAVMYSSAFPKDERWQILTKAAKDPVLWVRIEAVRELGRWGTEEASQFIESVSASAKEHQLRFTCRAVLAGLSEDLHGLR